MAWPIGPWQRRSVMKFLLLLLIMGALAWALPIGGKTLWQRGVEAGVPKEVAHLTARGLRATWDFVTAAPHVDRTSQTPPHSPPRHASRKAQARGVSREGIVAQKPKEKISHDDKAALDSLLRR
jgi:hypothetical protein